jgi:hypothetical protein
VTQPVIEDETRPCKYSPCTGVMTPELDGLLVVWSCGTCQNEEYATLAQAEGTCQMGLRIEQPAEPEGPVFLGTIGRRPE